MFITYSCLASSDEAPDFHHCSQLQSADFSGNNQSYSQSSNQTQSEDWWAWLKGSEPESHLYLGMWTWHIDSGSRRKDRWQNELVAFNYKSFFAGTFLNSFSERTYVVGIQRMLLTRGNDSAGYNIGYRLGGIYGYDEKFGFIAEKLPVLPLIQPYIAMHYRHAGLELSYIGVVFTAAFFIRF